MEILVDKKESSEVMRELAIQEKDMTLQWRNGNGKLLYVKLKKNKTQEAWLSKQITKKNIHEINRLKIVKNGRVLTLGVVAERSTHRYSEMGEYDMPVFYIGTDITKAEYDQLFGIKP